MWVWEHALFDYNPKRPDSTKKDKTVEVITKADHLAAMRLAKAEEANYISGQVGLLAEAWDMCGKREQANALRDCARTIIAARAAQIEEGE